MVIRIAIAPGISTREVPPREAPGARRLPAHGLNRIHPGAITVMASLAWLHRSLVRLGACACAAGSPRKDAAIAIANPPNIQKFQAVGT